MNESSSTPCFFFHQTATVFPTDTSFRKRAEKCAQTTHRSGKRPIKRPTLSIEINDYFLKKTKLVAQPFRVHDRPPFLKCAYTSNYDGVTVRTF